jgi:hypothetical protein
MANTDYYLDLQTRAVGGGIWFRLTPVDSARGKWFPVFVNGKWTGRNFRAHDSGDVEGVVCVDAGVRRASLFIGEPVETELFADDEIPDTPALADDATSADQLKMTWDIVPVPTIPGGDDQLSNIAITGARRGGNVAATEMPTRGRLHYTIEKVSL